MNPRGIPLAQFESNMEGDPKFQRLARSLTPARYYAVFGAYVAVSLHAWKTASRDADPDLLSLIPDELLAPLREVHLLDEDNTLPAAVFERWPGAVLAGRRKDADRKRNPRASNGDEQDSSGLQRTPAESSVEESRGEYRREIDGRESSDSLPGDAAGAAHAWTAAQWVAYVVQASPVCRLVNGRRLTVAQERMARLGDYYAGLFGVPPPRGAFGRLAELKGRDSDAGFPQLMADLAEAALRRVSGDPIDYISAKRSRNGRSPRPAPAGLPQPAGFDRDSYVKQSS